MLKVTLGIISQGVPGVVPEIVPGRVPEEAPVGIAEGVRRGFSEGFSRESPEHVFGGILQKFLKGIPKGFPG